MFTSLNIQPNDPMPMYLQLANALKEGIVKNRISKTCKLPSINYLSACCDVSKDTVEKAYKILRKQELVEAIPGKGYYVKESKSTHAYRILMLFNQLDVHQQTLHDHFLQTIGNDAEIELHVYHNDFHRFCQLIKNRKTAYSHYVIIPQFSNHFQDAGEILSSLTEGKLILLDKKISGIKIPYSCIFQNFERDIHRVLVKARDLIEKYKTVKLIFPRDLYHPREIIQGFREFCLQGQMQCKLVPDIREEPLQKGEVYIALRDLDLATLVKRIRQSNLNVGTDVGIIAYNDNPLKEVLLDGITVLSTDFATMGKKAAEIILNNEQVQIENDFHLILRPSL